MPEATQVKPSTAREKLRAIMEQERPDLLQAFDHGSLQPFDALVHVLYDTTLGRSSVDDDIDATDAARQLAADSNIDLADVEGTGSGGRITVDDVRVAIEARA